ncbi:hypothetical protein NON08_12270 [Cetobacterium somerae]|nr:hypothetical protein [Cetobacterium sp. NK01]MCQ8213276.1 hypothetical protein [Cetobacterium sp. NK01]
MTKKLKYIYLIFIIYYYIRFTIEKDKILSPTEEIGDSSNFQKLINEID